MAPGRLQMKADFMRNYEPYQRDNQEECNTPTEQLLVHQDGLRAQQTWDMVGFGVLNSMPGLTISPDAETS